MYDMKVKTPPMVNKRRSWTGRLKDRFKSSTGQYGTVVVSNSVESHMAGPGDDWTSAWVTHPHLQEGHHAPSVPSLQGSVFVAANFVYDYRNKYGMDPANGWMATPAVGSIAIRRTSDWAATRGLYPVRTSPVFRTADPSMDAVAKNERKTTVASKMAADNYGAFEFRAADVNQNIRQMRQHKQHQLSVSQMVAAVPTSPQPQPSASDDDTNGEESDESDESHPQTTVAVDRPGLIVSGQRICILTGQDSPTAIHAEKVSLKVEFQRNCPLRRSLSDRARPKMAAPASFHDTTRLTQKTRSRGSLHDLFGIAPATEPLQITIPAPVSTAVSTPAAQSPGNRRKTIVRPTEPPPPPPPPPNGLCIAIGAIAESKETPPVAPPRRIYRHSKTDSDSLPRDLSAKPSSDTPSVPVPPTLDLSPGITSWAGRPLIGQMVSWTAWSGHQHHQQEAEAAEAFETVKEDKLATKTRTPETPAAATVTTRAEPAGDEPKRRPVSRLWPSFSSIGRDRSASRVQADPSALLPPPAEEEHIYEEIDDIKERGRGLSRAGRGGSFAGASRQDILRYLEELRKKHPTGIISVEAEQRERKRPNSPSPVSPMTPSLPQLIPADEDEDDEMGALLLAMRHNAPNRNSNRSTQSSTSTQSSSQESALSLPGITPASSTGGYQNGSSGGGEIERNDSGVGSETSGTAQRLRRMRRLNKSTHYHQLEGSTTVSPSQEDPAAIPWCVDCDQPMEPDQEEHDSLVCHRCARRRCERREVLAELLETEVRYGRDLRVLQDELYKPLLVAGLVPLRQLDAVFLNVSELSGQSQRFGQRLREAVEIALEQGDEDLLTVDVARLFLDKETEEMMDAFRRYCVRSGEASLLLSSLEKERELLRIFLRASQLENPALRRMDLHAFLMVPVQRITKYPLLLGRLLRATAQQDVEMREALREAQAKVESYLTAINAEAKELGTVSRPWRRGYSVPNLSANSTANTSSIQRPSGEELMNLRLRKMAMDCLGWSDNAAAQLVMEGFVKLTQPGELLLTTTRSRGRTLKWQNVWMGLVTLNHQDNKTSVYDLGGETAADSPPVAFNAKSTVQEAAVVLIKDVKNARPGPSIYRDPLMLSYCTISSEADELPNFFEIHHIVTKESFICQTTEAGQTQQWLHRLRTLSLGLGRWKQRRNALPHVMMIN